MKKRKLTPAQARAANKRLAPNLARKDEKIATLEDQNASKDQQIATLQNQVATLQTEMTSVLNFVGREAGFATASHLHDTRYYTGTTIQAWFLRSPTNPQFISGHSNESHSVNFSTSLHTH